MKIFGKNVVLLYSGCFISYAACLWLKLNGAKVSVLVPNLGGDNDYQKIVEFLSKLEVNIINIDVKETATKEVTIPLIKSSLNFKHQPLLNSFFISSVAKNLVAEANNLDVESIFHVENRFHHHLLQANNYFVGKAEILNIWQAWDYRNLEELETFLAKNNIDHTKYPFISFMNSNFLGKGILFTNSESLTNKTIFNYNLGLINNSNENITDEKEEILLGFKGGEITKFNGNSLVFGQLINEIANLGKKYGISKFDVIEEIMGKKNRYVYEIPGIQMILTAKDALEDFCLDKHSLTDFKKLSIDSTNLMYYGKWYSMARLAKYKAIDLIQKQVNGEVKLVIENGKINIIDIMPQKI